MLTLEPFLPTLGLWRLSWTLGGLSFIRESSPWSLEDSPWGLGGSSGPWRLIMGPLRLTLKPVARDAHTEHVESPPEDIEAHPGAL